MHLKMSSAKWQPFCLGGDESNHLYMVWVSEYIRYPNMGIIIYPCCKFGTGLASLYQLIVT